MPVANYASEMLELWKIGCEENISIEFETEQRAYRFRFRMYMLRKDMRKEQHPLTPFAEKCMLKLHGQTITVCPVDDDFATILRKQGIIVDTSELPKDIPMEEHAPLEDDADSEMQKAVKNWKDKGH